MGPAQPGLGILGFVIFVVAQLTYLIAVIRASGHAPNIFEAIAFYWQRQANPRLEILRLAMLVATAMGFLMELVGDSEMHAR